jgi:hypothetical protein
MPVDQRLGDACGGGDLLRFGAVEAIFGEDRTGGGEDRGTSIISGEARALHGMHAIKRLPPVARATAPGVSEVEARRLMDANVAPRSHARLRCVVDQSCMG